VEDIMAKSLAAIFIIPVAITLAGCLDLVAEPAAPVEEALRPALRVKTDLARGMRWELGWGSASAYDTASGQLISRIRLPGATLSGAHGSCVPDMLLSRSGALIVSSNAQPMLWRISPARFEVERYDIEVDADQDKDFGFSGLAWSADERELYAVSAATGALWRIDLASAKASKVELSAPVRGACGLAMARTPSAGPGRQPTTLLVAIGSREPSRRIALSPDLARGEVTNASVTELAWARHFKKQGGGSHGL
jgi:hypothetical protein